MPPAPRFEVYQDNADEWRWRLVVANGNIIADSGEGYASKQGAKRGIESVKSSVPAAAVVTKEEE
ncbi:HVO_2922 family protein [Haloplanus ruber]|uniref:HVO_2922 family protein n=1 Tax=Haloplanus ruber TaxID=869892 RepID=A0ABD6D1I1_9EURY|nr:HVO_2922 family protein [Haloplanus ruber]